MVAGPGSSDEHADPVLQLLVKLTREGTIVAAFQATHEKFHAYHAALLQMAARAAFDEGAHDALLRTLDEYAALFHEHHRAEDDYFFPALRDAEPALVPIVDQLIEQHEQLADQLAVVLGHVIGARLGEAGPDHAAPLLDDLATLQRIVDEHLAFEEAATVPVLRAWTSWPV